LLAQAAQTKNIPERSALQPAGVAISLGHDGREKGSGKNEATVPDGGKESNRITHNN
jgi:hypothetical protein